MLTETKACSLTEGELTQLVIWHGYNLNDEGKSTFHLDIGGDMFNRIERINYLTKRLKSFQKPETTIEKKTEAVAQPEPPKVHPNTNSNWGDIK